MADDFNEPRDDKNKDEPILGKCRMAEIRPTSSIPSQIAQLICRKLHFQLHFLVSGSTRLTEYASSCGPQICSLSGARASRDWYKAQTGPAHSS